jgi:glycerophosphoryl diester phosphodiesterase
MAKTSPAREPGWPRRAARPLVIGHRGFAARFPENTLLSFREALAAGADGVECDVQKTADGRYVVIHDADLGRVSGSPGVVNALTARELSVIDVGRGERVPELTALVSLLSAGKQGALLDCELKKETLSPSDSPRVLEILLAGIGRERIMVSSFEPALLFPLRKSGVAVALLLGTEAAAMGPGRLARVLITLRPRYVNLPLQVFGALGEAGGWAFIRLLRAFGASLLFWTLDWAEDVRKVERMSEAIVTNDVIGALAALGRQ